MLIARSAGAEILSVDSMQVYRGMDIGTAKPSPAEQAEIRHHLIDLVDPGDLFTVARFVQMADEILHGPSRPLIAVGGTPLYYKALFEGLFEGPPADETLRKRLSELDPIALHARLTQVDAEAASRIHANDQRRIVRALEVFELTGKPISSFQTDWAAGRARHRAVWIGLQWEKEALNKRINARVRRMMAGGWLDEARALPQLSLTAAEATGYQELLEHLAGRRELDETIERIKIATRQLARRQMKWLRRFPHVTWLPGDGPLDILHDRAMELWRSE